MLQAMLGLPSTLLHTAEDRLQMVPGLHHPDWLHQHDPNYHIAVKMFKNVDINT